MSFLFKHKLPVIAKKIASAGVEVYACQVYRFKGTNIEYRVLKFDLQTGQFNTVETYFETVKWVDRLEVIRKSQKAVLLTDIVTKKNWTVTERTKKS